MKKLILLVLAIALFLPINSYAYTTFIGLDPLVIPDGITGVSFETNFSATINFPNSTTAIQFVDNVPNPDITYNSNFVPADFSLNQGTSFSAINNVSGPFSAGAFIYYTNGSAIDPSFPLTTAGVTIGFDNVTANYVLTKSFDFTSYDIGAGSVDEPGAFWAVNPVPLPSAIFLLAPGLLALFGLRRKLS